MHENLFVCMEKYSLKQMYEIELILLLSLTAGTLWLTAMGTTGADHLEQSTPANQYVLTAGQLEFGNRHRPV